MRIVLPSVRWELDQHVSYYFECQFIGGWRLSCWTLVTAFCGRMQTANSYWMSIKFNIGVMPLLRRSDLIRIFQCQIKSRVHLCKSSFKIYLSWSVSIIWTSVRSEQGPSLRPTAPYNYTATWEQPVWLTTSVLSGLYSPAGGLEPGRMWTQAVVSKKFRHRKYLV